jgi:hypothetical protein
MRQTGMDLGQGMPDQDVWGILWGMFWGIRKLAGALVVTIRPRACAWLGGGDQSRRAGGPGDHRL